MDDSLTNHPRCAPILLLVGLLAAADAPAVAAEGPVVRVRLDVVGAAEAADPVEVMLVLRPASGTPGSAAEHTHRTAFPPGETKIKLPAGGHWEVQAVAQGFWSDAVVVQADSGAETLVRPRLFPVGTLRGTFETAKTDPTPNELEVRWQPPPGTSLTLAAPRATRQCELDGPAFRCAVPAGRLDLRFRVPGFAAVYRWAVEVSAGGAVDLGKVALQPGASVVGFVTAEDGRAPAGSARVLLERQASRQGLGPEAERRLGSMSFVARADERGFFQFSGVPPGVYAATASLEGAAPAVVEGVEVRPGLEAEIVEPLVLARPVSFEARISPPHDPSGQPWQISMSRHDAEGFPVGEQVSGEATPDGSFSPSGLSPGTYSLRVSAGDGSRWYDEDVEVAADAPPVFIRLSLLEVEGVVRIGSEPLVATVWFGGRSGAPRVRFDTDLKGRFEGVLPRAGAWAIDLVAEEHSLQQSLSPVEVPEPDGDRPVWVEIELPDTRLEGEVVDETGRPLAGASVVVSADQGRRTLTRTGDGGTFSLRGLSPGSHGVRATADDRTSGWVRAQVSETGRSPRLRLVATRSLQLSGVVLSPAGPVPGARVMAWPEVGSAGRSTGVDAVSDPLGRFKLALPASTRILHVVVFAPGNALRMLQLPVDPNRPLELRVQPSGATLVLELPTGAMDESWQPQLAHGGVFVTLHELARWARLTGAPRSPAGSVVLPEMEPGDYVFCLRGVPPAMWRPTGGAPSVPGCALGSLAPHSILTLRPAAEDLSGASR